MFALVSENPKIIMLYLLVGTLILLAHFGRKSHQTETRE
jgi:hypothetical protein